MATTASVCSPLHTPPHHHKTRCVALLCVMSSDCSSDGDYVTPLQSRHASRSILDHSTSRSLLDHSTSRSLLDHSTSRSRLDHSTSRSLLDHSSSRFRLEHASSRPLLEQNNILASKTSSVNIVINLTAFLRTFPH